MPSSTTPPGDATPSGPIRSTTGGAVRGVEGRGIVTWRGIPYAAAPVGPLRFRAPQPAPAWRGVRSARHFGPVSPQDRGQFVGVDATTPQSEDCLTVNVIAPAAPAASSRDRVVAQDARGAVALPVLVYVHGGAYSVGSSREFPTQGEQLVRQAAAEGRGIVYVSLNYRLGGFGFVDLSHWSTPERPLDSNLGLRDVVAALEWVRDNIASFGGDPARVTLCGESAGANAVTTLMTVPRARSLFHAAIAQSSPTNAVYPPDVTRRWGEEFLELLSRAVQDDDLESTSVEDAASLLDRASAGAIVKATARLMLRTPDDQPGSIALSPVIDGDFLPERPLDAFKAGRAHPVPLIIGTNDREGSVFTGRRDILATTPLRIRSIFANTKKKARKAITKQYPGLPARRPALDFGGDFSFWYPTIKVTERHARFADVYAYRFDAAPRILRVIGIGAFHGLELTGLFGRTDTPFGRALGLLGGRRAFIRATGRMRARWLEFVTTSAVSDWPTYDPFRRRTLIVDTVDRVEHDPRGERRRVWQEFVPHL